ncbi:MAG: VOC family protein [Gemmatimonadaceae bacterium]
MTTGIRKTNDFCWINILTPQPAESQGFFSQVLGWTYADLGGMGSSIKVDGKEIGGMFDLASPQTPPGTSPGIGIMVKSDDADATVEKANALGGSAKPAFDIMEEGRMAELKDPNGAQIDIWQPKKSAAMTADSSSHGAPSWYENYASDVDKAKAFYTNLFGWTTQDMPVPGMVYTVLKLDGEQIAGMMKITPDFGPMPPTWATYFTIDDVDKRAAQATELGGTVFTGPMDIPDVGRFAGVLSPQGVRFFIIKYLPRS